jgi:hypothetical protein
MQPAQQADRRLAGRASLGERRLGQDDERAQRRSNSLNSVAVLPMS